MANHSDYRIICLEFMIYEYLENSTLKISWELFNLTCNDYMSL